MDEEIELPLDESELWSVSMEKRRLSEEIQAVYT